MAEHFQIPGSPLRGFAASVRPGMTMGLEKGRDLHRAPFLYSA
jgi:hypothetical protein